MVYTENKKFYFAQKKIKKMTELCLQRNKMKSNTFMTHDRNEIHRI